MKKVFAFIFKLVIVIFAVAGFGLLAAYISVNLHLTDTKGIVDTQSDAFWKDNKAAAAISLAPTSTTADVFFNKQNYCFLKSIKTEYPGEFTRITNLALNNQKALAQKNLDALSLVLSSGPDKTLSDAITYCNDDNSPVDISKQNFEVLCDMVDTQSPFAWANSDEWNFFKTSVVKDKDILDKVQAETGINSRILVSQLAAEQMRLFYSNRPWFKKAIEPLKVLGSMTQFSWGVFGIKEETALGIENNLKDQKSEFYLGKDFETLLDFKNTNVTQERFSRITDSNNHYYAYLYAALYNKEIMAQWQKAGFDISDRPEILATLFNIGFTHSQPNANPQVGGSELQIGDDTYSFGRLAFEFYYSGELLDEFPQDTQSNATTSQATPVLTSAAAYASLSDDIKNIYPWASLFK